MTINEPDPDVLWPSDIEIVGRDHPLSLGYRLYLRLQPKERPGSKWQGLTVPDFAEKIDLIVIQDGLPAIRTLELVVHEVSHYVDTIFERVHVKPCTELRAYYNDWIVGKMYYQITAVVFSAIKLGIELTPEHEALRRIK